MLPKRICAPNVGARAKIKMKKLEKILRKLGDLDEQLLECVQSELQRLRDRGLTYRDIQPDINPAQVYKIMTGAYRPKLPTLKRLAKSILEVD